MKSTLYLAIFAAILVGLVMATPYMFERDGRILDEHNLMEITGTPEPSIMFANPRLKRDIFHPNCNLVICRRFCRHNGQTHGKCSSYHKCSCHFE